MYIKMLQTLSEAAVCKQGWVGKVFENLPFGDWWHLMVLCQLPSMTILLWVALCGVKAHCLRLWRIFVSLKNSVQHRTLLFTLWKPAEGDNFRHLQKTWMLSMHNNASNKTDLVIACLFENWWGLFVCICGVEYYIGLDVARCILKAFCVRPLVEHQNV